MTASQQSTGRVIIVLGMHRSGTSVLTECIHLLGAGIASQVIAPNAAINRDGFFEDAKIVALNEQLLSLLGSSWYDFQDLPSEPAITEAMQGWRKEALAHVIADYAGDNLAVIKDPRMSRLFSFWAPLFEQAKLRVELVHILRRPEEVAISLQRRNRMPPAYGLLLWCAHVFDIVKLMANGDAQATVTVMYDSFTNDSLKNIRLLAELLHIGAANASDHNSIAAVVGQPESVLTPADDKAIALIPDLREFAARLYQSLASHCVDGKLMITGDERARLEGDYRNLLSRYAAAFVTLRVLTEELIVLNGELVNIGELHAHAQTIVAERDDQLAFLNTELARVGAELEYAQSVVVERDGQLAELNTQKKQQVADLSTRIARYQNLWLKGGSRQSQDDNDER